MSMNKLLSGILFIVLSINCQAIDKPSDFFKSGYITRFVQELPAQSGNKIMIISTRHLIEKRNFAIKAGVDPHYRLYYFIAATIGDTAYVKHIPIMDSIHSQLDVRRNILIYVDGHGKKFDQTMERGFELSERFHLNVVVFDWPTDYMALRKTIYSASEVTVGFIKAMRKFDNFHHRYFSESLVSVIFHSMGNHIILNIAKQNQLDQMPARLFTNIILNAAAVKQRNHAKWVERLNIQKRIYITKNKNDFNLRGAAILRMSGLLGLSTKNSYARNAYYVDFGDIATFEHNLFLGKSELENKNPDIYKFYNLAFNGKEAASEETMGFHIFKPSEKSLLFSIRSLVLESP